MAKIRASQNVIRRNYQNNKTLNLAHSSVNVDKDTIGLTLEFAGGFTTSVKITLDFTEEIALLASALTRYENIARVKLA